MKTQTDLFNKLAKKKQTMLLNELTKEEQIKIGGGEIKVVTVCIKGVYVQKIIFV